MVAHKIDNRTKGNILEEVAAWLHATPGVIVRRDVRLSMIGSRSQRRQFDVMLSSFVAGHEVRLVVECKNEERRTGSPQIDAFRGKLEAVGIPPSLGIYVAAHGYTTGAIEAARAAGIKALHVEGLSADQLSLEVAQAFQSLVVLLPQVARVNLLNDLPDPIAEISEAFLFYDEAGDPVGTVADFVWEAWLVGDLKPCIGATILPFELPEGWHNVIEGKRQDIRLMSVTVNIVAMVTTLEGQATRVALVGAEDKKVVREGISATFEPPAQRYQVISFDTKAALKQHLTSRGLVHMAHYIKSPRLQFWNMMFWPPSKRVADIIAERLKAFDAGKIPDPRPFSFEQLEGRDLATAWEPIAEEYMEAWREKEKGQDVGSG